MEALTLKCNLVGDKGVGQKSLVTTIVEKKFPDTYFPMTGMNPSDYHIVSKDDNKEIELQFWCSNGGEDYDRLRPLSYQGSNVVLLCFALNNRRAFQRIEEKYFPEVRQHCGNDVPVILVGTKLDLRDNANAKDAALEQGHFVNFEEGRSAASRMNAAIYIECSALIKIGLEEIATHATKIGYDHSKSVMLRRANKSRHCCNVL